MASSTDDGQHRARELYKIFQPDEFRAEFADGQARSPDPMLTSQAQLVAWRLNARRCTVSFLDQDTQYNVAEGTKTLHLDDTSKHDAPSDSLWLGCTPFSSENSMCLYTLKAQPTLDGTPQSFEVLNVAEDPRFSWLPFVHSPPYIKYYYGTPLKTSKGTIIGSLCILDDKPRPPLTPEEKNFMATIGTNIINHFELIRERTERKRATAMNRCLTLFVDPQSLSNERPPVHTRYSRNSSWDSASNKGHQQSPSSSSQPFSASPVSKPGPRSSNATGLSSSQAPLASITSKTSQKILLEDKTPAKDDYLQKLQNAADLLRTSFDLADGGDVLFLGSSLANLSRKSRSNANDSESWSEDESGSDKHTKPALEQNKVGQQSLGARHQKSKHVVAEVLASSMTTLDSTTTENPTKFVHGAASQPRSVLNRQLARLIDKYPRGKLWTFDLDGRPCSDSEDSFSDSQKHPVEKVGGANSKHRPRIKAQDEAELLLRCFPGAHQIIFSPFWNVSSSRWCVCLISNLSRFRTFTYETDFLYCIVFCNCVQIELARIAVQQQDQQKADFIGSISHELRSPLHGIMASCEFLQDSQCSPFQRSLFDTVDSCARTLLDTISMVLDYSKINSFERDWRKTRKLRRSSFQILPNGTTTSGSAQTTIQPALNIYGNVDIAAIAEEVVEGVTVGQTYQSFSAGDLLDMYPKRHASISRKAGTTQSQSAASEPELTLERVEVILEIAPRDWSYVTQPGAFRRILMNLVGNALKYTKRGWIRIKLDIQDGSTHNILSEDDSSARAEPVKSEVPTHMVELTVTDTGKGISQEYLRTKLFTAFSQEDQLASGTGLGLSLVKSIVAMLEGEIDIQSSEGVGTEAKVRLPMVLGASPGDGTPGTSVPNSRSSSSPSTANSKTRSLLDVIENLKSISQGRSVAFFYPERYGEATDPLLEQAIQLRQSSVERYISNWYGLQVLNKWAPSSHADVLLLDEEDLSAFSGLLPDRNIPKTPSIVVLCSNMSRLKHLNANTTSDAEFVSKPIGPYKLAKALNTCFERINMSQGTTGTPVQKSTIDHNDSQKTPVSHVERAVLVTPGRKIHVMEVGGILGNNDSSNAQKALAFPHQIESTSSPSDDRKKADEKDPFAAALGDVSRVASPPPAQRPQLKDRKTMLPTASDLKTAKLVESAATTATSRAGAITNEAERPLNILSAPRAPRVLLVDDNAINLRLLLTFMTKRKCGSVYTAHDGAEAVQAFKTSLLDDKPHDIIFMDISMPIMNGFEATQLIRKLEQEHFQQKPVMQTPAPALIIALTGLASGKDQSEAFASGVDLYMTKPVSFKEVGRLLDNWTVNGGAGRDDEDVPHGALSEMTVNES